MYFIKKVSIYEFPSEIKLKRHLYVHRWRMGIIKRKTGGWIQANWTKKWLKQCSRTKQDTKLAIQKQENIWSESGGEQARPKAKLNLALKLTLVQSWRRQLRGRRAKPGLESFRRAYCSRQSWIPLTPCLCARTVSPLMERKTNNLFRICPLLLKHCRITDTLKYTTSSQSLSWEWL